MVLVSNSVITNHKWICCITKSFQGYLHLLSSKLTQYLNSVRRFKLLLQHKSRASMHVLHEKFTDLTNSAPLKALWMWIAAISKVVCMIGGFKGLFKVSDSFVIKICRSCFEIEIWAMTIIVIMKRSAKLTNVANGRWRFSAETNIFQPGKTSRLEKFKN